MTQNDIDPHTLSEYLVGQGITLGAINRIEKFFGRPVQSHFRLSCAEGSFVLRAQPPGELLKSAHQVDREYRVMNALQETGVPVPRMIILQMARTLLAENFSSWIIWTAGFSGTLRFRNLVKMPMKNVARFMMR